MYNVVYIGVVIVGFLVALLGVSKGKRWAVRLLQVVSSIVYVDCLKTFAVMSFWGSIGITAAIGGILSISLVMICATKVIKNEFQFKPGLSDRSPKWKTFNKVSGRVVWLLVGLLFVTYLTHYYYIYPKRRITYQDQSYNADWESFDLLNRSFQLPKGLKIVNISDFYNEPFDFRMLFLEKEDESLRIGVNVAPGGYIAEMFQYRNSYEFNRRLLRMIRFIAKSPFFDKEELGGAEIDVGEKLDGFLFRFKLESKKDLYYFLVFDKSDRDITGSLGITFDKKDPANENIVRQIMGSLRLAHNSVKTDEVYFSEALAMISNNQYIQAQESLVNALDQDWNNPEYHYQLALAFKATSNNVGAKSSLGEVIQLNPDYKDAKQLLDDTVSLL